MLDPLQPNQYVPVIKGRSSERACMDLLCLIGYQNGKDTNG